MQKAIRILNPVSDCRFTTRNRAARFIKKGHAEWVRIGMSIRFLSDADQRATRKVADNTRIAYDLAANSGMAKMRELANTPVSCPARALGIGRRKGASRHTFLSANGWTK